MQKKQIFRRSLAALVLASGAASADELIARNWIGSREDLYLVSDSVRWLEEGNLFFARYYFVKQSPTDQIETFDENGNSSGWQKIGLYRSYAYDGAFDCGRGLEATATTRYYSTPKPSKANQIYKQDEDIYFGPPMIPELLNRVCEIAAEK